MVFLLILGVVVVLAVTWFLLGQGTSTRQQQRGLASDSVPPPARTETNRLVYVVPEGQDPAAVLADLDKAGYPASLEERSGDRVVGIECPQGIDRSRAVVRSVIAGAGTAIEDGAPPELGVRFADERVR